MKTVNDYRKSYPNKTDEQIINSLSSELSDKVETIYRLLSEIDDLKKIVSEKRYTEQNMKECWKASQRYERPYNEGYAPNYEEFIDQLNEL